MSQELFDAKPKLNRLPSNPDQSAKGRFPKWLHRKLPRGGTLSETNDIVKTSRLSTVCEEAKCPNRLECYSKKTATFLALGSACTRACGFCDIDFTKNPLPPEVDEPQRIAQSARALGLKHVVITMVARDDLPDQGAEHIAKIIRAIRSDSPLSTIEVLTSDYCGNWDALNIVLSEKPEVFNHNIETVRELTPRVRHKATYERTLQVLDHAKRSNKSSFVKSGLMVGLGESEEQVQQTLQDLHTVGCDIVTIGQYLQASKNKLVVKSFVTPEQFNAYRIYGEAIGIGNVYSGPFVRSSYNADLLKDSAMLKRKG
ncbi:MAG: lipoyl synthase [Chlamydiia bacterium]|nr:lipoyl synthase [Chlamydiia bacterium]MCP5509533.1 lipoyl synthase [Chlamydiales bacterium]HPE84607.1 lipoyl synthase [Chlamydiales bacterium]